MKDIFRNITYGVSIYMAGAFCLFALLYTMFGSTIYKVYACTDTTVGIISEVKECPKALPGIVPHTYTISIDRGRGTEYVKLKRSLRNFERGQEVTVCYEDDKYIYWYISFMER